MRLCTVLVLIALTTSCAATKADRDGGARDQRGSARSSDANDSAFEIRRLEVELRVATLEAEAKLARAERRVSDKQNSVTRAQAELATFETERSIRIASADLSMDRSRNNLGESQMELDELIAMYEADQFATTTKELVVSRSRARLEFSRRNLEIAEREHRLLLEVELPRDSEDLTQKLDDARFDLEMARHDLEVTKLESALDLERKQRELDAAKKKAGAQA